HDARLGEERLGGARGRQRGALAVDDRTALRLQHDRARVLPLGERGEVGVAHDLQPAEASENAGEREGQQAGEDEDADAETAHAALRPSAAGWPARVT